MTATDQTLDTRSLAKLAGLICLVFFEVESLQASSLSMREIAPKYNIIRKTNTVSTQQMNLFLRNLNAALLEWHKVLDMKGPLAIDIVVDPKATRISTASLSNIKVDELNGKPVYEDSAAYKIRTGKSVQAGKSDLVIRINPEFLKESVWLDPNPMFKGGSIPAKKTDGVSILRHELFHAFGVSGFRDHQTGQQTLPIYSRYDQYVKVEDGNFYFTGPHTMELLGEPLPLTSNEPTQNMWHIANRREHNEPTKLPLMNGVGFQNGYRYNIGPLEVAIARDLGLPVREEVIKKVYQLKPRPLPISPNTAKGAS